MPPSNEEKVDTSGSDYEVALNDAKQELVSITEEQRTINKLRQKLKDAEEAYEAMEKEKTRQEIRAKQIEDIFQISVENPNETHALLLDKSLQLAEVMTEVDHFKNQAQKMEKERQKERTNLVGLNAVLKSLQSVSGNREQTLYSLHEGDLNLKDLEDVEFDDVKLTAEKAVDMTLRNMKFKVEHLEEKEQHLNQKLKAKARHIDALSKELDLYKIKVEMLEEIFLRLTEDLTEDQRRNLRRSRQARTPVDGLPEESTGDDDDDNKSMDATDVTASALIQDIRERRREGLRKISSLPKIGDGPKISALNTLSNSFHGKESKTKKSTLLVLVNGKKASYTGTTNSNGAPHGTGALRFENGDTYLGGLVNGAMHGKGTLYHRTGMQRGQFQQNAFVVPESPIAAIGRTRTRSFDKGDIIPVLEDENKTNASKVKENMQNEENNKRQVKLNNSSDNMEADDEEKDMDPDGSSNENKGDVPKSVSVAKHYEKKAEKEEFDRQTQEEVRAKAEEETAFKEEEGRLKAEEEARLKTEEEARLKAVAEARVKAEKEARLKTEEGVRIREEEEGRSKAEEGALHLSVAKPEEEACIRAKEEDRSKADEEDRSKAEEKQTYLEAEENAGLEAEEKEHHNAEEENPRQSGDETGIEAEEEDRLKEKNQEGKENAEAEDTQGDTMVASQVVIDLIAIDKQETEVYSTNDCEEAKETQTRQDCKTESVNRTEIQIELDNDGEEAMKKHDEQSNKTIHSDFDEKDMEREDDLLDKKIHKNLLVEENSKPNDMEGAGEYETSSTASDGGLFATNKAKHNHAVESQNNDGGRDEANSENSYESSSSLDVYESRFKEIDSELEAIRTSMQSDDLSKESDDIIDDSKANQDNKTGLWRLTKKKWDDMFQKNEQGGEMNATQAEQYGKTDPEDGDEKRVKTGNSLTPEEQESEPDAHGDDNNQDKTSQHDCGRNETQPEKSYNDIGADVDSSTPLEMDQGKRGKEDRNGNKHHMESESIQNHASTQRNADSTEPNMSSGTQEGGPAMDGEKRGDRMNANPLEPDSNSVVTLEDKTQVAPDNIISINQEIGEKQCDQMDKSQVEQYNGTDPVGQNQALAALVTAVSPDMLENFGKDFPLDSGFTREQTIHKDPLKFYKFVVEQLLQKHEPQRLRILDMLLTEYSGREDQLVNKLSVRYNKEQRRSVDDKANKVENEAKY